MKGDLIERDDVLDILYEIKDNDDIPKKLWNDLGRY